MSPVDVISSAERGRLARLITRLQDDPEGADETLAKEEATQESAAHTVGISGVAGAGKSTLISRMLPVLRGDNLRVVVLAIDPTSEGSQGALLGDRIRMRDSYRDEGVFIRSLATRGAPEALTVALPAIIRACSSSSDLVIVETAGAGQVDVGIRRHVNTFVAVVAPLGDAITLMKSGQTEHAHIVAVNVRRGLEGNDRFRATTASSSRRASYWGETRLKTDGSARSSPWTQSTTRASSPSSARAFSPAGKPFTAPDYKHLPAVPLSLGLKLRRRRTRDGALRLLKMYGESKWQIVNSSSWATSCFSPG